MPASTRRGRPRSFDRAAALDRAIRLFWRDGYDATSVRDLGDELGISAPSLYGAFGDKPTLFTEAVDVYDRAYGGFIEDALRTEATGLGAARRILREAPARYTRRGMPPGCLVACGDLGATDPAARRAVQRVRDAKTEAVRVRLEADRTAPDVAAATDPAAVAGYVMAVLSGLAQQAAAGASRRELERIATIAAGGLG